MWEAIGQMTAVIFIWLSVYLIPIIAITAMMAIMLVIIKKL